MTHTRNANRKGDLNNAVDYRYRAYGMSIRSDISLPELDRAHSGLCDLRIRLCSSREQRAEGTLFEFGAETQRLSWSGAGSFAIHRTNDIEIKPAPNVAAEILHLPLLGPVMGVLLHLRGMMVLHASAVAVSGQGAAFLGNKGIGKSTLAAALIAAGHRLLADDLLAVRFRGLGKPLVVPGFPQLKLGSAAADAIVGGPALPALFPGSEKRQLRLTNQFSHAQLCPTRMYVLEQGLTARTTPMSPQEAFGALVSFTYVGRFGRDALGERGTREHFRQCASLARTVPFSRLAVPHGLANRLSDVVKLVEDDLNCSAERAQA